MPQMKLEFPCQITATIKILTKKLVGYTSFQVVAEQKGFWNPHHTIIPKGYLVETDGFLWSIRREEEADQE